MKSRKLERKPLSFSTTMRNPERIVLFIENLKEFEGKILTKEIIMKIVEKLTKLQKNMLKMKKINKK